MFSAKRNLKRYTVHEAAPRIYTTDAVRHNDRINHAVPLPKQTGMRGLHWHGNPAPDSDTTWPTKWDNVNALAALEAAIAKTPSLGVPGELRERVAKELWENFGSEIVNFGTEMSTSRADPDQLFGGLTFGRETDQSSPLGTGTTAAALNAANRDFWAKNGQGYMPSMTRDATTADRLAAARIAARDAGSNPIAKVAAANKAFWGSPSTEQPFSRPWGKG
jgi:hypothetical protein